MKLSETKLDDAKPCFFNCQNGQPLAAKLSSSYLKTEFSLKTETACFCYCGFQVKNETHALWTWHRNQNSYLIAGDIIYIVRQPDECGV